MVENKLSWSQPRCIDFDDFWWYVDQHNNTLVHKALLLEAPSSPPVPHPDYHCFPPHWDAFGMAMLSKPDTWFFMCLWHDMPRTWKHILLQWIWNREAKCVSSLGVGVLFASNLFLPHSNGSIYIEFISMTWKCWPSKWPPIFQALHWNAQYKPKRLNCLMIGSNTGWARTCEHGTVCNILQDPK